jgi:uncharacterized protein YbcI
MNAEDQHHGANSVLAEISNEMVRLYKEQFGRGPTRARSHWAGKDTLVCTLEDTLTPAERNLIKAGEQQRLRETRLFFQYASTSEFGEPVERLTGRKIKAFISGIDTAADGLSAEVFVLHPDGSTERSRLAERNGDRVVSPLSDS